MRHFAYIIFSLILFLGLSVKLFSQTRFNKVIDCEHQTMNILVNVLPIRHGYLLVVGSGDVDGYGSNRCTMLVKIDEEGEI